MMAMKPHSKFMDVNIDGISRIIKRLTIIIFLSVIKLKVHITI
jgi:hypothetical protein